jgi:hypothetical protein
MAGNETKDYRRSLSNPEDSGEEIMSHEHIAQLVTAALVAPITVTLPLLDFIGPPCARFLQRRRDAERSRKATLPAVSARTVAE